MYGARLVGYAYPVYYAAAALVSPHSVFVPVAPSADASYQSFRGHRAFFTCTGSRNTIGCTIIWSFSGVPHGHKFFAVCTGDLCGRWNNALRASQRPLVVYPLAVVQDLPRPRFLVNRVTPRSARRSSPGAPAMPGR